MLRHLAAHRILLFGAAHLFDQQRLDFGADVAGDDQLFLAADLRHLDTHRRQQFCRRCICYEISSYWRRCSLRKRLI